MGQNLGICCDSEAKESNGFGDEKRFASKTYVKVKNYPIINDYFFERKIGVGSYGVVHLGV